MTRRSAEDGDPKSAVLLPPSRPPGRRAKSMGEMIESTAGALLRYRIREEASAAAAMDSAISLPSRKPPEEPTDEMQEIVRQCREQHMQQWLNDNIPAVGGLTPRRPAGATASDRPAAGPRAAWDGAAGQPDTRGR